MHDHVFVYKQLISSPVKHVATYISLYNYKRICHCITDYAYTHHFCE